MDFSAAMRSWPRAAEMIRATTRAPPTTSSASNAVPARCARLMPASVIQGLSARIGARLRFPLGGGAARSLSINPSAHAAPNSGADHEFIAADIRRMAAGRQEKPLAGGDLGVGGDQRAHWSRAAEAEAADRLERIAVVGLRERR